jgi:uncharacterized damage-inducible protein DinB
MNEHIDQLLKSWRTNNRINLFLIDHISEEGMKCTLSKRGGRNVVRQFAHLHNVRVWHLKNRARELSKGLYEFATAEEPSKETLKRELEISGERIERFLRDVVNGVPKRRGFKKGVITTLAYFVAHESHHRGSILLTLKQCGHKLDQKIAYAIWDWDKR